MTADAPARSAVSLPWVCAVFALVHGTGAAMSENQNAHLLHALARARAPRLALDWRASTRDPFPVFTTLAEGLLGAGADFALPLAHLLCAAVYFYALIGIVDVTFDLRRSRHGCLTCIALLFLSHSRMLGSMSMRLIGVDARALLNDGVANQYVLGPVFQPSLFGVCLLLSICLYLRGRPLLAILCSSLAATMHPSYVMSAATLTLSYAATDWRGGRRRNAISAAALSLALVMPVVLFTAAAFRPSSPDTFARAADVLARTRIPAHAHVATWFGTAAVLKCLVCVTALWIVRRRPIFGVLWPALVFAILASTALAIYPSPPLELQFPWRVSVWLVPISAALIVGRLAAAGSALFDRAKVQAPVPAGALAFVALLATYGIVASVREARVANRRPDAPLRDWAARINRVDDIRLIPPEMDDFRLLTATPIVVDFKSPPYRDIEVLEWNDRLQRVRAFYARRGPDRCSALRDLVERYRATQLVVPASSGVSCAGVSRVYEDGAFAVYAIGTGSRRP